MLLAALTTMCHMEMPQINVLSKVDLAERHGSLLFGLDFYTEVLDLNFLLDAMNDDPFLKKYHRLNASLVDVIENRSLVSFLPLCVSDVKLVKNVRAAVDKANGYVFGAGEENQRNLSALLSIAVGAEFQGDFAGNVSEKYLENNFDGDDDNSMSVN